MKNELTKVIETRFANCPNGGEFMLLDNTYPYKIYSNEANAQQVIYATKSHASLALWPKLLHGSDLIARPGLPDESSLRWLDFVGQRPVQFLGDLDPPDLLTFLWLRESLPEMDLSYAGISDTFLAACGADVPENYLIDLSLDEQEAYTSLRPFIEPLSDEIGAFCLAILQRGKKMELEAVVSTIS